MEDNQQVIIEIETNYSEAVKLMAQYRAEADRFRQANADLKKELKEGKISQEEYNIQTAAKTVDADLLAIQTKYMNEEVEVEFTPIPDKDIVKAATGCEAMNIGSLELIREKLKIKEDGNNN